MASFSSPKFLLETKKSVLESWSTDCGWSQPLDYFIHGEIQLVCNIDGAKVFRSKLTSVWPIWIQVQNLPPVLRCSFLNRILFSLWYEKSKPDFDELLIKLTAELDRLVNKLVDLPELGRILFRLRCIVCDIPAKASMLCMLQFNGYFGCPHCFMRGVSHQNRMLYPCNAPFVLRNEMHLSILVMHLLSSVLGIKKRSPLCNVFKFPWDAPLDPMHQVFLGTGKVLSKSLLGLLKDDDQKLMSELIKKV